MKLSTHSLPSTHREAIAMLNGENSRTIANNTVLIRYPDDSVALRLHATHVVVFRGDNSVILDTGGWESPTTKQRINGALGHRGRVASFKSTWYYYPFPIDDSTRVPFRDGMVINANGTVCVA